MLSPVLAGEKSISNIILNDRDWYAEQGITLKTGDAVIRIERVARQVISESGEEIDYDRLMISHFKNSNK
jgi:nitrite reductase (NADH) large subunit